MALHYYLIPTVQYIMQENVGQHRTKYTALWRPHVRLYQFAIVNVPSFQEFLYQLKPCPIHNPDANKFHQLIMWNTVEKSLDVCFYNMVHWLEQDQVVESFQRLMATSARTKPIRTVQKISLVYGFQYPRDSPLYYLVLKCGYAYRSFLRLTFGNIDSLCRLRLIFLTL